MDVKEILDIANTGYPDSFLEKHYNDKGELLPNEWGDTLARFVVVEIIGTYDDNLTDEEQLEEAIRVISGGESDLNQVCEALREELSEMMED